MILFKMNALGNFRNMFSMVTAVLIMFFFIGFASCQGNGEKSGVGDNSPAESTEGSEVKESDAGSTGTDEKGSGDESGGSGSDGADTAAGNSSGKATVSGVSLSWSVNGESVTFTVEAATDGWVAVGFNPSRMMKDADFIIGYVKNGNVFIRDDYGNSMIGHDSDENLGGTDNIMEAQGTESGGSTSITFTIPLNSGDSYDQPLASGQKTTVLLAYGNGDNFTGLHKKKGKTEITL